VNVEHKEYIPVNQSPPPICFVVYGIRYTSPQPCWKEKKDKKKMQVYTSSLNFEIISPRVPPVPHKGLRMYSSAAEATGGAVAITGAVVVQDTPRSSVLGPAIVCSRATHVPPVLPLLFPFPPGFAVAPASILLESQTRWVCSTNTGAAGNIEEGQTNVHHIFRSARTSSFLRCRFV